MRSMLDKYCTKNAETNTETRTLFHVISSKNKMLKKIFKAVHLPKHAAKLTNHLILGQTVCFVGNQHQERMSMSRPLALFQCEKTLRDKCYERRDKWRQTVESRIETVNDLRAADAVYPQQCSSNFRTDRKIPMKRISDTQRSDTATQPAKKGKSGFVCVRILIRNIGDGS